MALSRLTDRVGQVLSDRYRLLAPIGTGASASVYLADDVTLRRRVRGQDPPRRPGRRRGVPPAVPGRGPGRRRPQPPAHHGGVRLGPRRRPVPRHRVPRRRQPARHARHGRLLSPSQALLVGLEAARGLDYAHRRGFVHRDIKPANLLFDEEARLRIADFGLARALAEAAWTEPQGAVLGTARYASPEQARGEPLDGRADVYSLALVLIEAVTGSVPVRRRHHHRHAHGPRRPPGHGARIARSAPSRARGRGRARPGRAARRGRAHPPAHGCGRAPRPTRAARAGRHDGAPPRRRARSRPDRAAQRRVGARHHVGASGHGHRRHPGDPRRGRPAGRASGHHHRRHPGAARQAAVRDLRRRGRRRRHGRTPVPARASPTQARGRAGRGRRCAGRAGPAGHRGRRHRRAPDRQSRRRPAPSSPSVAHRGAPRPPGRRAGRRGLGLLVPRRSASRPTSLRRWSARTSPISTAAVSAAVGGDGDGFTVTQGAVAQDGTVPGQILLQDPEAGATIAQGGELKILVSTGPPPVPIPGDLVGQTLDAATKELATVGLVVGDVGHTYDEKIDKGVVDGARRRGHTGGAGAQDHGRPARRLRRPEAPRRPQRPGRQDAGRRHRRAEGAGVGRGRHRRPERDGSGGRGDRLTVGRRHRAARHGGADHRVVGSAHGGGPGGEGHVVGRRGRGAAGRRSER